jgi:sugar phosphate isomerase/epimerase
MSKVRVGRDLTNQLSFHFLTDEEKKVALKQHKDEGVWYPDILEAGKQRSRVSIIGQVNVIKALNMNHLELDLSPKHPYEKMFKENKDMLAEAREYAQKNDVTVSGHLSYSYVTASACAPQTSHRKAAVSTFKTEVDIIKEFGAKNAIMHAGTIPFWEESPANKPYLKKALTETLYEVGSYAAEKGITLELENNVVADNCFYNVEECMEIIEKVNSRGVNILFCWDVGHYMTRADRGLDISPLEKILEDSTVAKYATGVMHLNGYIPQEFDDKGKMIPGTGRYHPLLHKEESPLKISNIKHHAELNQKIGTKAVVIESAASGMADMLDMNNQLKYETEVILECYGYDKNIGEFNLENIATAELINQADKIIQPLFKNGY